jgi:hydroxyacylglutathione hydrolase
MLVGLCSSLFQKRVVALSLVVSGSTSAFTYRSHVLFSSLAATTTTTTTSFPAYYFRKLLLCSTSVSNMPSSDATTSHNIITVAQFPCLSDNYGYLIHDSATGQTAAVDTPDASAYTNELEKRGWTLTHIFNTHHHFDHVGGNMKLKRGGKGDDDSAVEPVVYGPAKEASKIPGIDRPLQDGDEFEFGSGHTVRIMDVGGHTMGHIAYYFPNQRKAFVGDSLFALGCGRMFEGTATQFWTSLKRLRDLPDDTLMYWYVIS